VEQSVTEIFIDDMSMLDNKLPETAKVEPKQQPEQSQGASNLQENQQTATVL
jgi:hypothetical protein